MKILEDIKENPSAFEEAPNFMKMDIEFVREAAEINPLVLDFVTDEIKTEFDENFTENVSISAKDSLYFLDDER